MNMNAMMMMKVILDKFFNKYIINENNMKDIINLKNIVENNNEKIYDKLYDDINNIMKSSNYNNDDIIITYTYKIPYIVLSKFKSIFNIKDEIIMHDATLKYRYTFYIS